MKSFCVDKFQGTKFLTNVFKSYSLESAMDFAENLWKKEKRLPENKNISYQVNQILFDSEGNPDTHVTHRIFK